MEDTEALLVDFYNGAHALEAVAGWAHTIANRGTVLQQLAAFEGAYEELVALHSAGKLGVGDADFSMENLQRLKRVSQLIKPLLGGSETCEGAQEICDLARECLQGLSRK